MTSEMEKTADNLNQVYYRLELKQAELTHALFHRIFELESGFYNGHYRKQEDGSFHMDYYPIPVISVKKYCDIEIGLDSISISSKLKRNAALSYDYSKLHAYRFDVYGVEDYLADYYHEGMTVQQLLDNLRASEEREIAFSFRFDFDTDGETIYAFVKLLRREGFYY